MQTNARKKFLIKEAQKAAIRAAVQHNQYKSAKTGPDPDFHHQWRKELEEIGEGFMSAAEYPLASYLKDVEKLAKSLQEKQPKINISHAQKSLGLYLKYLWCLEGTAVPPACPLDRAVLEAGEIEGVKWTALTSMDQFTQVLRQLQDFSKNLAEWELGLFNQIQSGQNR